MIAFGASQSAGRLATYITLSNPSRKLQQKAFDGFILDVYFGNGTTLDTSATPGVGVTHVDQITDLIRTHGLPPGGHLLRDVGVPVFVVNSESESLSHFPVRQPDTDTYRFWEFAGHAHGTAAHHSRRVGKCAGWHQDAVVRRTNGPSFRLCRRRHPLAVRLLRTSTRPPSTSCIRIALRTLPPLTQRLRRLWNQAFCCRVTPGV